jgi:hypothetical protein
MKGIDIIIPVHKYNSDVQSLLDRCLTSIKDMATQTGGKLDIDVHVVGPKTLPSNDILDLVKCEIDKYTLTVHENDGELDFASQVNFAVSNVCNHDYFMVVEFDDMVTAKWLNMAMPYIEARPKCSVFLPLVEVYDINNPSVPLHYINEIGWSSSFAENELGSISNAALQDYCNFNFTGAIVKKNDFVKAGGLKPSIKLSFNYELLLRLTNLYNDIYVVPKVGYFHFVNREDSLTTEYHNTMTQEEGSWWIKLALQEYQYKRDREKTYSPDEE